MWKLGDRVLALWPGDMQWWYPGVIVGTDGDEYELQFDDGDRSYVPRSDIAPVEFPPGAHVQARIGRELIYVPATVLKQEGYALLIRVSKEAIPDGTNDVEFWTSVPMIRVDRKLTGEWLRRN